MNIQFTDNSKEVSEKIKKALLRGLETCGLVAEGYAKKLCPVDTRYRPSLMTLPFCRQTGNS